MTSLIRGEFYTEKAIQYKTSKLRFERYLTDQEKYQFMRVDRESGRSMWRVYLTQEQVKSWIIGQNPTQEQEREDGERAAGYCSKCQAMFAEECICNWDDED